MQTKQPIRSCLLRPSTGLIRLVEFIVVSASACRLRIVR